MPYFSTFYGIEVRDDIVREFTDSAGRVDDMLAGLHEVRARMAEQHPWLKQLHADLKQKSMFQQNQSASPPFEFEKQAISMIR